LNVRPEGAEAFEVTKKVTVSRVNLPRIGDPSRVLYHAGNPDGARVQRRTPEDLAAAVNGVAVAAPADPLDQLKKLNDLRQTGALSDSEFEAQKAKILAWFSSTRW
jgi:hypothetical protein